MLQRIESWDMHSFMIGHFIARPREGRAVWRNWENSFNKIFFLFSWPCIFLQILANNQLDALFHVFIYFMSLHVSRIIMLIIRGSNCINTSSGMISLCKWLLSMPVLTGISSSRLHRLIIPDDVLIQFDLLMMSTVILETRRDMK